MPASNKSMMRKLQLAINSRGYKILLDRSQFYSESQDRPVTLYKVMQSVSAVNGRSRKQKLFESSSQIQVVLYLRDYWYWINDWEIPTDNEAWNKVKAEKNVKFSKEDHDYGSSKERKQEEA